MLKKCVVSAALAAVPFFLSSCQTMPKGEPTVVGEVGSAEGQWRGKARVRDLRTGRENMISLDVIAREPAQLRLEVTGAFGTHLASIALNNGEVRYILTRQKRFVTAPADSSAFARLVPVRIPPSALLAILFDRELSPADWRCSRDPKTQLLKVCEHLQQGVRVQWLERQDRKRRLEISARDAEIEMILDEAKSKVEFDASAFVLTPPSGFKQEKLTRSARSASQVASL